MKELKQLILRIIRVFIKVITQFHGYYCRPATLLKKRLWHRCFPANFAKFLRTLGGCFWKSYNDFYKNLYDSELSLQHQTKMFSDSLLISLWQFFAILYRVFQISFFKEKQSEILHSYFYQTRKTHTNYQKNQISVAESLIDVLFICTIN